jgi:hypothetical protein
VKNLKGKLKALMYARRTAYEKSRAISSFANKSVIQIPWRVTLDRLQVVEEKRIIISLVKFVALFLVTDFIAFDTKCTCRRDLKISNSVTKGPVIQRSCLFDQ